MTHRINPPVIVTHPSHCSKGFLNFEIFYRDNIDLSTIFVRFVDRS